jgi:hypothetical protein
MPTTTRSTSWVVYGASIRGKATGLAAVCNQGEWEAMERAIPGGQPLIKAGIATEGEAERFARTAVVHVAVPTAA